MFADVTDLSRRTFLRGASTAGVLVVGAPTAWATAESDSPGVHEQIVRDARMVWRRVPTGWDNSPFLANGFLGVQVYRGAEANVLRFMLSHSQVQDQRVQWEAAVGLSRLPIGYLTLTLAGAITQVDWTLDLWNAELTGTITTTQGSLKFNALVHNDRGTLLVSFEPTAGESTAQWGFQPMRSHTTRTIRLPPEYVANPDPTIGTADETHYVEQPLLAGGGYTTAWQEKRIGTQRLLAATVAYGYPDSTGLAAALANVRLALMVPPDWLVAAHRAWWNSFYTRSLVSVPDKWVQRFYWAQLYKMACATRANAPVVTEWGPWFPDGGGSWTAVWWNLNVQVSYPFINGSNHTELDAVTETFRRYHENLTLSVPPDYRDGNTYALAHPGDRTLRSGGPKLGAAIPGNATVGIPGTSTKTDQTGNLIWAMHGVWVAYRHSMDRRVLRDVLYPTLVKALNFYLRFLTEGTDGRLHLPLTRSPEYADAADCTYDLSLIRWASTILPQLAQELRIDDPNIPRWRDVSSRLTPYHQNADGVMIGDGVALTASHRHFSHLLWVHPLREKADLDLFQRSFNHWSSMRTAWAGYSYPAASSMSSLLGQPEQALRYLRYLLDGNVIGVAQLMPNTMYKEGSNLAIESPLTAAQSVLDMLVDSDQVVRVFPAVSASWPDVSVAGLRTQGAFLVDASRRNGRTEWIRVHSEAGEPLVLQHGMVGDLLVRDERGAPVRWRDAGQGRISLRLGPGETAVVTGRGSLPDLRPRDVPANTSAPNWGLP